MHSRVKVKLVSTLIGIVTLILVSLLYLNALSKNVDNIFSRPQPYVAIGLIVLATVFGLAMVIKVKREGDVTFDLKGDYLDFYGEIVDRLDAEILKDHIKSEVKDEIALLLHDLQENNRSIESSIGDDFLSEMLSAYGQKNSWLLDILTGFQYFVFYLLTIQTLMYLEQGGSFFEAKVDVSLIVFFFIMSFVAVPLIFRMRRSAMGRQLRPYRYILAAAVSIGLALAFIMTVEIMEMQFATIAMIDYFLNGSVVCFNNILLLLLSITFVALIQWKKKRMS